MPNSMVYGRVEVTSRVDHDNSAITAITFSVSHIRNKCKHDITHCQ